MRRTSDMTIIEPSGGSVVLRGIKIEVDSDIGHAFVTDCVRFIEGLVSEEQLRKKYQLDDAGWQQLAVNEPLQQRVGAQKEKRIRNGEAAREKAAHLFVEAPTVLGDILRDPTNSPRHRVDAIRELRACAGVGAENKPTDERERFVININFGKGNAIHKTVELKPIEPKRDEEDKPLKLIEPMKDDEYEPEWYGDV
jgi:hypothetical protein